VARKERGAAAVEMAIVLPLLLLVVGGLVDLGRAYYLNVVITNASREGARMVAMGYTPLQATARAQQAEVGLGSLGPIAPTYTTCPSATGNATATITIPSGPANSQFHWLVLNVVPSFFGGSVPTPSLSATGSMRCNG